jgi:hypothetical protein
MSPHHGQSCGSSARTKGSTIFTQAQPRRQQGAAAADNIDFNVRQAERYFAMI